MQLQELHMLAKKKKKQTHSIEIEIHLHLLIILFANDWIKILMAFSYCGLEWPIFKLFTFTIWVFCLASCNEVFWIRDDHHINTRIHLKDSADHELEARKLSGFWNAAGLRGWSIAVHLVEVSIAIYNI